MAKSGTPKLLRALATALDELSQAELDLLLAGKGRLIYLPEATEHKKTELQEHDVSALITKLSACNTREDAQRLLVEVETKDRLVALAKAMKVHTIKNDRREDIESKIIAFAIGGRLRSEAINTLNLGSSAPDVQTDA
jgi:transcriptional regulator of NAD metabolism